MSRSTQREASKVLLAVFLGLVGCGREAVNHPKVEAIPVAPAMREIASPARPGSGEPNLVVDRNGGLLLSWLEPAGEKRTALRLARFENGSWSAPVTVVERDDLFVNWADFPSIAVSSDGSLFAHWLQKSGDGPYAYDVMLATSADGGQSWGDPFVLHQDGRRVEHGFVSMVPAEAPDQIAAVWLDGREMSESDDEAGAMTIRFARVAANGTIADRRVLDDRTCECCKTGLARVDAGFVAVYRDRAIDEVRDIAAVRIGSDGVTEPRLVHADGWTIEGCPVNGPAIVAHGDAVSVVWYTAGGGTNQVLAAFSSDGGESFSAPVAIDEGDPVGRVDVALMPDGSSVATWIERADGRSVILARRISADGKWGDLIRVGVSSDARSAGFPRVEVAGDVAYFAWTEPGDPSKIRISAAELKG